MRSVTTEAGEKVKYLEESVFNQRRFKVKDLKRILEFFGWGECFWWFLFGIVVIFLFFGGVLGLKVFFLPSCGVQKT